MIINCISLYLFGGIMLLSFLFVDSFLRSKSSYAKALGILSLVLQIYLLGYLMEVNSDTLQKMLFWNQIQYFGIPFFPPLWLVVSMLYTGRGKFLQGLGGLVVFAIPLTTFFFRLTNRWHHLYYSNIQLQSFANENIMLLTKGPWYVFHMCYVLVILVLCNYFYFQRYKKSNGDEKIQFRLLLIASVLPYIALVLVTLNIGGIGIDYTALILPPCILLIYLALTRYNFLEVKVLARERVFEDSTAGLILLNRFHRIVDFNDASIPFFKYFDVHVKEEYLDVLLENQPEMFESIKRSEEKIFKFVDKQEERYVNISVRDVINKEIPIGYLITLEDVTERELMRKRLTQMANTDELSGLNNRRRFRECSEKAYERAQEDKESFSVLMIDIDFFKKINDSFGHQIGDAVIRDFSGMLSASFHGEDIVGRMGGEEFAVVLLNTTVTMAFQRAEDFRRMVEARILTFGQQQVSMTISIGVAELGDKTTSFDALLNQADNALYEAKRNGRNRTIIAESKTL